MSRGQFRFGYFTPLYEETVAFYRDRLGFPLIESWNRNIDDRGSLFSAASGIIEVIARPTGPSSHPWDDRPPQGAFMVVEVTDVDAFCRRVVEHRVPLAQRLTDQPWGHRSFCVMEPGGLTLSFFQEIS
jgi:catechol 2,3-dioxygenase-like lactoylglutathione lyase family enzyme